MTPLFITPDVKDDVRRVRAHTDCPEYYRREDVVPGDDSRHVLEIPAGFRVVYSVQALEDEKVLRHLSMSVSATGG